MSLVKAVRLGASSSLSSRRRRDIADLRDCIAAGEVQSLIHINGQTNTTDPGTKAIARALKGWESLREIVERGFYTPHISADHAVTFESNFCLLESGGDQAPLIDDHCILQ